MMAVFHYLLAVLEGFLAGACFHRAGQSQAARHKVIMYAAGVLWFAASVLDALEGGRERSKTLEINGGKDDE